MEPGDGTDAREMGDTAFRSWRAGTERAGQSGPQHLSSALGEPVYVRSLVYSPSSIDEISKGRGEWVCGEVSG